MIVFKVTYTNSSSSIVEEFFYSKDTSELLKYLSRMVWSNTIRSIEKVNCTHAETKEGL